jgi:hypothetical protein
MTSGVLQSGYSKINKLYSIKRRKIANNYWEDMEGNGYVYIADAVPHLI